MRESHTQIYIYIQSDQLLTENIESFCVTEAVAISAEIASLLGIRDTADGVLVRGPLVTEAPCGWPMLAPL